MKSSVYFCTAPQRKQALDVAVLRLFALTNGESQRVPSQAQGTGVTGCAEQQSGEKGVVVHTCGVKAGRTVYSALQRRQALDCAVWRLMGAGLMSGGCGPSLIGRRVLALGALVAHPEPCGAVERRVSPRN